MTEHRGQVDEVDDPSGDGVSDDGGDARLRLELDHQSAISRLAINALSPATSLTELVRRALAELQELLPAETATVLLVDDDELEVRLSVGTAVDGRRFPLSSSVCDQALRTGELVRVDDAAADPLAAALGARSGELGPAWAVPIGVYSRLRLLACIGRPAARDNPLATATLQAVAGIIAGAAQRQTIESEVRATELRFRRLAENVPDAVFRVRFQPQRRLDYVSPRLAELTGRTIDELTARDWDWHDIVPDEDLHVVEDLDVLSAEVVRSAPYRIIRPDGSIRWVETRVTAERDIEGRVVAMTGITSDITARREAEETVRRTLEHEQRAAEQLRRLAELKNALLAAVSHELRTPLTAVMGFAEVLRTTGERLEPLRRDRALAALERNAQRLEHLLSDLLDLDRLDRGVVEPVRRPVDLALVVDDVIDRLEQQQPTIDVDVAVLPRILEVDAAKIERVIENLVMNALKHTPAGSQVWIRSHDVDDGVLLTVEDDGPGIPDEQKSLVFEPFERGTTPSPVPGTGIGLSLVRRFVELHGGEAWIEDRDGGGSSFNVWLPDISPE